MLIAASASGEVLVYEGFSLSDYTKGYSISGVKSGNASVGLSTQSGWGTGTGVYVAQDNGLPLPSAWTVAGSKVHGTEAGRAVLVYNQSYTASRAHRGQQRLLSCTWPDSGSVYFRFLMRVPQVCLNTSYLGNWNYVVGGLGFDSVPNATVDSCAITNGLYMGVRNRNGTIEAFAYVQPKGGTLTSHPLFNVDTTKQLDCVFVAKIDIGENGHDTLSLYACQVASWSNDFAWKEVINDIPLVSSQDKFKYLQLVGQYRTNNQYVTLDEFIVTTDESEAYTYRSPGAPTLGDVALSRTGATYSLSATERVNDASLSWIANDGTAASTNGIQAVAEGNTANWTISGLGTDKTYMISVLAENDVATHEKEVGAIYTGELTIGTATAADEGTLMDGTVAVSRAGNDQIPLTLNYTITGSTGTQGVTWEAPAAVTIPAGQTTGYLLVKPLVDMGVSSNISVTVTLAEGNYEIPASASAEVTIVNSDVPSGWETLMITNAFDNPAGGFFTTAYASALKNEANRIIRFVDPEDAIPGLREFVNEASQYNVIEVSKYLPTDWMLYTSSSAATAAETVDSVRYASQELAGLVAKRGVRTYAGSWYVPAEGTYSFRMHMNHTGILSIDGKLILRQTSSAATTVRDVALTAGWHNFYVALAANASGKIAPASGESCGLTFNASNDDLAENPAAGHAFDTSDGYKFSTAFNAVLLPAMWAKGGDVVVDCTKLLGDLRLTGQIAGASDYKFKFVNLPAGRTLEFGRPHYYNSQMIGWQNVNGFGYVDWTRMEIPSGVNIRFEGTIVVNNTWTQSGHGVWNGSDHSAFSLGKSALIFTEVPNFFGSVGNDEFVVPEGLRYIQAGTPDVLGSASVKTNAVDGFFGFGTGGAPFILSSGAFPIKHTDGVRRHFYNDFDIGTNGTINCTLVWFSSDILHGNILSGNIRMTGWARRIESRGSVNISALYNEQRDDFYVMRPTADSAPSYIGYATLVADGAEYPPAKPDDIWNYAGASCFYIPETPGETPLSIGTLQCTGAYWYSDAPHHGGRRGATLSTCSNSTVNVGTLTGYGVHLRRSFPMYIYLDESNDEKFDCGFANFVFGEIKGSGTTMKLFVSTNVNITVTNVAKAAAFDYTVMSNAANAAVLDIVTNCAAGSTIKATDVGTLPARIKGFVGDITITGTEEKTYPVTFDFDNHGGVPVGGCDGSGNLVAAPTSGTIELSFAGAPRAGDWGILRFDSVPAGQFDGWTISPLETTYKVPGGANYAISVTKGANGFSMHVSRLGFEIIVR